MSLFHSEDAGSIPVADTISTCLPIPMDPSSPEHGMISCMDGHALLGHLALCSGLIGDGGPRAYRRRGKPLPEKYLPGRFLAAIAPDVRASVVEAANAKTSPAPWFLRLVVDEEVPIVALPPPVDRRWSCRGRWSTPSLLRGSPAR